MIRSVVLFAHVIGILVLFIGMAFEWLSLESLRRATSSEEASPWVRLQEKLPRVYGIAFVTLLVSGMYLARRVGVFEFAWVRLGLGLLVLMGLLGARGFRRRASHAWLRASLSMRAAMGLAAVYLMIDKPLLGTALVVTGVALAVGLMISLLSRAPHRRPSARASFS